MQLTLNCIAEPLATGVQCDCSPNNTQFITWVNHCNKTTYSADFFPVNCARYFLHSLCSSSSLTSPPLPHFRNAAIIPCGSHQARSSLNGLPVPCLTCFLGSSLSPWNLSNSAAIVVCHRWRRCREVFKEVLSYLLPVRDHKDFTGLTVLTSLRGQVRKTYLNMWHVNMSW